MSGSEARVAPATSTGSRGRFPARSRHVSTHARRTLEVLGADARAVVEVGERARYPADARGATSGELTVGDELTPHVVGVGAQGQQARHRAGGHVRVLRPGPVGVASPLSVVGD